jgi:hypothetical protein
LSISDVRAQGAFDGRDVRASKQVHVNHQRIQLVKAHAVGVARGQRINLLVGREATCRKPAEEAHHRQIYLAVAAVDGRVDETRGTSFVGVQIAAPEVTVKPRRRLDGPDQLREASEKPLEVTLHAGRRQAAVDC